MFHANAHPGLAPSPMVGGITPGGARRRALRGTAARTTPADRAGMLTRAALPADRAGMLTRAALPAGRMGHEAV